AIEEAASEEEVAIEEAASEEETEKTTGSLPLGPAVEGIPGSVGAPEASLRGECPFHRRRPVDTAATGWKDAIGEIEVLPPALARGVSITGIPLVPADQQVNLQVASVEESTLFPEGGGEAPPGDLAARFPRRRGAGMSLLPKLSSFGTRSPPVGMRLPSFPRELRWPAPAKAVGRPPGNFGPVGATVAARGADSPSASYSYTDDEEGSFENAPQDPKAASVAPRPGGAAAAPNGSAADKSSPV
ncbi:unnamed protein product, partial [Polarella glacialis]